MRLTLVTPPVEEPVTIDEAREYLGLGSTNDFDAQIAGLIRSARQKLDGAKGTLGRCLMQQTWRLTLDDFPRRVTLPLPPLRSVDSVSWVGDDAVERTLSPSLYVASGAGDEEPAVITFATGIWTPTNWSGAASVAITFTAGYGAAPEDVPEPLRTAILMMVAHVFENREAVTNVGGFLRETPLGFEDHVRDYRVWGC